MLINKTQHFKFVLFFKKKEKKLGGKLIYNHH